jgi:hypothetical protein
MTDAPKRGSTVYFGDKPRRVVHVEGTFVVTVPADCDVRGTHQGNLQNRDGEYEWRI